jgi:hypothetical protein
VTHPELATQDHESHAVLRKESLLEQNQVPVFLDAAKQWSARIPWAVCIFGIDHTITCRSSGAAPTMRGIAAPARLRSLLKGKKMPRYEHTRSESTEPVELDGAGSVCIELSLIDLEGKFAPYVDACASGGVRWMSGS